jgi:TP901 family phage tail tape measure protein
MKNIQVLVGANNTNLSSVLAKSAAEVQGFQKKVEASNHSAISGAKLMGAAFLGAGVAIAAGLAYGVAKAIQFETSMRNVNSLSHLGAAAFRAQEQAVISMSTRLPQSAKILADGLYDIVSSGFEGAGALKVLDASATAASAGLTTTAVASKAITAVLNAYGRGAKDAADVSDVLFQTVNLGVIDFAELSGVIADVAGPAAAAKVGIEQVGSAIATMTLTGISGAEAGTSLNRVLQAIIKPTDALRNVLHGLGYESGAAALEQDGLHTVMEKVRVATGGNVTTLLSLFSDIRATRGALALMSNEGRTYTRVSSQIENANARHGATLRALHEQMKSVSFQWSLFKNNLDAAAISAGTHALPVLIALMGAALTLGHAVGGGLSAALKMLGPFFRAAAETGQNLWHLLVGLLDAVGPLAAALGGAAFAAFAAVLNVIGPVLATITGLMASNRGVVLALAIAYGISAFGGVSKLATAIGVRLVLALDTSLAALGRAEMGVRGFTATLNTAAAAETAATLGLSAAITAGVLSWERYANAGKDAAHSIKQLSGELGTNNAQAIDTARKKLDQLRTSQEGSNHLFSLSTISLSYAIAKHHDYTKSLSLIDAASAKLNTKQQNLANNTATLGSAYDLTRDQVIKMADAAGIDLTGALSKVSGKFQEYYAATAGSSAGTQAIVKALGDLANSAGDAQQKVTDLKNALDALMGQTLGVRAATRNYQAALDDLTASVKTNGRTLDNNTAKGRANNEALDKIATTMKDVIVAQVNSGVSTAQVTKNFEGMRASLISSAVSMGMSKKQAEAYATSLGLVPSTVETIIKASGAKVSAKEVQALIDTRNRLQGKTVSVAENGALPSKVRVADLDKQIAMLRARIVMVSERGAPGAAAEVKGLRGQIQELKDRQVAISQAGAQGVITWVGKARAALQSLNGFSVTTYIHTITTGTTVSGGAGNTLGGILRKADGGVVRYRAEGHEAEIAPAGVLRVWAEPETGGEAYIPLSPAKRGRSLDVLSSVAHTFGVDLAGHRAAELRGYAQPAPVHGGVSIAPGAITLNINTTGTSASPDQLARTMRREIDGAMRTLNQTLAAGRR